MMPQTFRTAILTEYGQDALDSVTIVVNSNDAHLPLGWGIAVRDGDSLSSTYGSTITVDPRFTVWDGCSWRTARWFVPVGQIWARRVLGDFA